MKTRPARKTTRLDEEQWSALRKWAMMSLYFSTGDGFIMHMNDGTTWCRECVARNWAHVAMTIGQPVSAAPQGACFADLFTVNTAGTGKCGKCRMKLTLHVPPPPISEPVMRMTRNRRTYSASVFNRTLTMSNLPNKQH